MVAAERDQMLVIRGLLLDQREAFANVAERDVEIADIGNRQRGGIDPPMRMIAVDQHAACLRGSRQARSAHRCDWWCRCRTGCRQCERGVVGCGRVMARKLGGSAKVGTVAISAAKRNTAAATAQVQRPASSPTAAAVIEVLPKMRLLV